MIRYATACYLLLLFALQTHGFALQTHGGIVEIAVEEPTGVARQSWPVTSGIPLAAGQLQEEKAAALFAEDGRELPLQTEALARWPDGSVRWLLLDFQVDLQAKQKRTLTLRYGKEIRRASVADPVDVDQTDDGVVIRTGPMRLAIARGGCPLPGQVSLDLDGDGRFAPEEQITDSDSPGVVLIDEEGREFSTAAGPVEISVEQSGPMRACVRLAGHHVAGDGHKFRYIARIHAYRGRSALRIYYTFINDCQQPLMSRLKSLDFVMRRKTGDGVTLLGDGATLLGGKVASSGTLLQVDENQYVIDGKPAGRRAAGWVASGDKRAGMALGLREFWQNWPKGLEVGPDRIKVGICPAFPKGLYDNKPLEEENKLYYFLRNGLFTFKCGVARTHELWATFAPGPPDGERLAQFFQAAEDPLLATCDPAYVSATEALGKFPPADNEKYAGYDAWLGRAFRAHLDRRDSVREYGMLNYGDWYGERKVNWGNLEYDLAHGLFIQYLRTGDRRYFLRAEQAARHHIDVDVVHTAIPASKDPWIPSSRAGEIWLHCLNHTGGYYRDAPLPVSRAYQVGYSTNFGHVWVSGDFDYYYLSGDRRAREIGIEIADAMAAHCPTRYGNHIRALGWPMILLIAAYEATDDSKYLDAAVKEWAMLKKHIDWKRGWVVRLAKGHCNCKDQRHKGNVPFMEGLTCCALARYHRITKDPEVLKAISVGIDQMIRECWQEDLKTFRYTACPHSPGKVHVLFLLSVEAMAYEIALTGNQEHRRILREGLRAAIPRDDGQRFGKALAQMIHFTPHALAVFEEEAGIHNEKSHQ